MDAEGPVVKRAVICKPAPVLLVQLAMKDFEPMWMLQYMQNK